MKTILTRQMKMKKVKLILNEEMSTLGRTRMFFAGDAGHQYSRMFCDREQILISDMDRLNHPETRQ